VGTAGDSVVHQGDVAATTRPETPAVHKTRLVTITLISSSSLAPVQAMPVRRFDRCVISGIMRVKDF